MKIRNYKHSDYANMKELLEVCNLFDMSYDTPEKFARKRPRGSIIVAEDKLEFVGCVIFTWDGWDTSIYRLCVHPYYRNKGLGSSLMEEAEKRLKKLGADVSSLRVHIENKEAERFFRKRGYYGQWGPYLDIEKKLK